MDQNNIRTFKDFLAFYNLMSQTCFAHCIDNFKSRELDQHEIDCTEKCAHKLIRFNNRTIGIYADVQSKLTEKRVKEMQKQEAEMIKKHAELEKQQTEAQQGEVETKPTE